MNKNNQSVGRPKGATSFERVSVRDLLKYISVDKGSVVASKSWLEDLGYTSEEETD